MAYAQADLDAIDAAISTGARSVKFGAGPDSREVHYRSLSEMQAVRTMIANAILGQSRPRTSYVIHDRG